MKKTKAHTKIRPKFNLPKIIKGMSQNRHIENFPLDHYSYSTFVKFSTNPILFKINYINGATLDTTRNISGVIGQAFHNAMETYYGWGDENEPEAIKDGLEQGMKFLSEYNDGFIEFSSTVKNKQRAQEIFSFAYNSYVQEKAKEGKVVSCEQMIEMNVDVEWRGKRLALPVKLKGYVDKIVRGEDGKLKIVDYKTTTRFSDPEKIDGAKILQAIQYYLLVYAEYGEKPYSITFEEIKTTKNRDGSPQVREYEVVYEENEQFFDFYFRMYDDVTRAINGEAVFVPNIYSMFDNEVAIISYIHRLDVEEEAANLMRKMQVDNITDLLKKQIHNAGSMRKFLKTAEEKFLSAKNLNYDAMKIEERIQTKLMEHGMNVRFEKKIEGHTVDLYQFNPSIGLKMSKLMGYVADVEQVIGVSGVRVLAPIPNTTLIGFEVPRAERTFPEYRDPIDAFVSKHPFDLSIGVDVFGNGYKFDIRQAPHLLVAGATGSGKSVFLNSLLMQLEKRENVELHLFDPKRVELIQFKKNAVEYQSDAMAIGVSLMELTKEMEDRYAYMEANGLRNMDGAKPYKFIVIDEFGDLTLGSDYAKEILASVVTLAQKARAAGMHLIIATQRPSVDVITGVIKANFPTKAVFRVAKEVDSRVVLDQAGAEKLLGKGDMIFSSDSGDVRLQGYNA